MQCITNGRGVQRLVSAPALWMELQSEVRRFCFQTRQKPRNPNQCTNQRVAPEAQQPPRRWTHQPLVSGETSQQPHNCLLTFSINPLMAYLLTLMVSADLHLAACLRAKRSAADVTLQRGTKCAINQCKSSGQKELLWVAQDTAKRSVL